MIKHIVCTKCGFEWDTQISRDVSSILHGDTIKVKGCNKCDLVTQETEDLCKQRNELLSGIETRINRASEGMECGDPSYQHLVDALTIIDKAMGRIE